MTRGRWIWAGAGVLGVAIAARAGDARVGAVGQQEGRAPRAASAAAPAPINYNDVIQTYCGDCHNNELKRGDVSFDNFDIAKAGANASLTERMIRKLQAGMMPPPGNERPDP